MANGDVIIADDHFLHQQSCDALTLFHIEHLRLVTQSRKERL